MKIEELAKLAGVSSSTVSKALNDSYEISYETKQRIKKIAEENGFYKNHVKKGVTLKREHCIAIIFSRKTFFNIHTNMLCATIQTILMEELEKTSYCFTVNVSRDIKGNSMIKKIYHQNIVDGFILASDDITDEELRFLKEHNVPFVFAQIAPNDLPSDVNYFINDNFSDGYECTKFLISMGFTKIITISNPKDYLDYKLRTDGYIKAMDEANLVPNIIQHSMNQRETDLIINNHLHTIRQADALFIQWDGVAGVIMQQLLANGIKIPQQLSVMGYNDFPVATYFRPHLTTMHDARNIQCHNAVEHLIYLINDKNAPVIQSKASGYIIKRGSVKLK